MDDRQIYVRDLLDAYRATPGTLGVARRADRDLAGRLFDRGVPLPVIRNALLLATARRLVRSPSDPPLPAIRSLAYFRHVIDEVLAANLPDDYFHYLRETLRRLTPSR